MSGSGPGHDLSAAVDADGGTATLVLGRDSHDAACRHLASAGVGHAFHVRVATAEPAAEVVADTDDHYETGVYDDLALADAGVAVADTVGNLGRDERTLETGELVVCVDGVPAPSSRGDRERLFRFLEAVTRRVREADGHCHVHLPVAAGTRTVAVVAPLFEYVVDAADAPA